MTTIVVEGCDGAGKTTLIEAARGNQKERYFITARASRYQPTIRHALNYLNWIQSCAGLDLVLDRIHFISDRIYGPVLRGEDVFKDYPIDFGLKGLFIIHCRPPLQRVLENVSKGIQLEGVVERTTELVSRYDTHMWMLRDAGVAVFDYDYTRDSAKVLWDYAWKKAEGVK